jgi:hypothetical protein
MPRFAPRVAAAAVTAAAAALGLLRWILALAIVGAGLASLTVVSHVRGATAPIEQIRSGPIIMPAPLPGAESADGATGLSGAQPSSPVLSAAAFRFGFLEFEDDTNAPSK